MKYLYISLIALLFLSCVQDPESISYGPMFGLKVDGNEISNTTFIANNTTRYLIQLTTLDDIEIKNNKNAIISVSDGIVTAPANVGATTAAPITLPVVDGKVLFYYMAGRKAKTNTVLTVTVEGITQTFPIIINPSEPDTIQLVATNLNPHVANSVELTAYLLKDDQTQNFVSSDLRVSFIIMPEAFPIIQTPYDFALSTFSDTQGVIAKTTLSNTTQSVGGIEVIANYEMQDGTFKTSNPITINYIP